jgi:hypothetical protein
MTPRPAPLDASLAPSKSIAATALAAAMLFAASAAEARPLDLSTESGIAALAGDLRDFRGATRIRWVIAAADRATAEMKRADLLAELRPLDRDLIARVDVETLPAGTSDTSPKAWARPVFGSANAGSSCSWQVWVVDPDLPGADDEPVITPLAPNDRMPVGRKATFRVGHAGLLQSRLYAFGETSDGAVRDLATSPDVNVPVVDGPDDETIVLATAREATPFLESLKTALADSQGRRLELGPRYALRGKIAGQFRGIGANIQAIPESMIAGAAKSGRVAARGEPAPDKLVETCIYVMVPHS